MAAKNFSKRKDHIISVVSEYYGVDIFKNTRKRKISFSRMTAMYLLWKYTDMGVIPIGKIFGRSHSSVSHSVKKVNALCWGDEQIRGQLIELESKIE